MKDLEQVRLELARRLLKWRDVRYAYSADSDRLELKDTLQLVDEIADYACDVHEQAREVERSLRLELLRDRLFEVLCIKYVNAGWVAPAERALREAEEAVELLKGKVQ